MTADLAYPEPWLRGWVDILRRGPGGREMPVVEVSCLPPEASKVHGRYLLDDHVVRLYPGEDRAEALCTLLHELAHAFAPYERASHGKRWRETLPAIVKAVITTPDDRPVRVSDASMAFVLDTWFTEKLAEMRPSITLVTGGEITGNARALCATLGEKRRATFQITEAA